MRKSPEPVRLTVAHYVTPEGVRCLKSHPQAKKVTTRTETYYVQLPRIEEVGRTQGRKRTQWVSLGTSDKAQAWAKLKELLTQRALGQSEDPYLAHARRPILDHLADWLAFVAAEGTGQKQVGQLRTRVGEIVRVAGWARITDITRDTATLALATIQADPRTGRRSAAKSHGTLSAQTRNHYAGHLRQFCLWLSQGRLRTNPVHGLKMLPVDTDRRHDRRCPDLSEVEALFAHLAGAWADCPPPVRCGMSGACRALGYAVSMSTGLRAGELRAVTPEGIDTASGEIRLPGRSSKRRRRDLQPLPSWLLPRLKAWLEGGGTLWDRFPPQHPGRLLRDDLDLARDGWIALGESAEERVSRKASGFLRYEVKGVDGPLYWDFHALRHWYCTHLAAQPDISPATLLHLARHSDPRLTLQTYGHQKKSAARRAADQLPEV